MTREERLTELFAAFDHCAREYCRRSQGIFCEIVPIYKGAAKAENLKYRCAFIDYQSFCLQFKYTAHSKMNVTNSILECLVHLGKNDSVAIPLPLFLNYLEVSELSPLCIPSILDADDMKAAFDCIESVLSRSFALMSDTLGSEDGVHKVLDSFIKEMGYVLNIEMKEENFDYYVTEHLYTFLTLRLTSAPFINYMKGDFQTASKQLLKQKRKTGYEESLLTSLQSGEAKPEPSLVSIRRNLSSYGKSGVQNTASGKEFLAMFLSFLLLTVLFSLVYGAFYFLLLLWEGRNSVFLMGPFSNWPFCLVTAFITAIAASYFARFKAYRILFPKHFQRYSAVDQIANGKGADKLMRGLLSMIVIASAVFLILFAKWNVRFEEEGIVDNSPFLSISGVFYDYNEIDRVYYKPNRVNDFGETLDSPSYVIVLSNDKEIDLYQLEDIEKYEDQLLPFLQTKGVTVEPRDSASIEK